MSQPHPAPASFDLHPQLAADSWVLGDLPHCRVLLMKDANYPWLILVPRQPGVVDIHELAPQSQAEIWAEVSKASQLLKSLTGAKKTNVAALGNMVPQLHIHVIARNDTDPAWPKPIWGQVPAKPYAEDKAANLRQAVITALGL